VSSPADPQHEGLVPDLDPEVAVGDAATERLDRRGLPGQTRSTICDGSNASLSDPFRLRIEQRLLADAARDPLAEVSDSTSTAGCAKDAGRYAYAIERSTV